MRTWTVGGDESSKQHFLSTRRRHRPDQGSCERLTWLTALQVAFRRPPSSACKRMSSETQ